MSRPDSDNIIFNINKNNPNDFAISSEFFQSRNQNIVNKIEDYYLRVYEAKIPITEVPFFVFKPNTYSVTIGGFRVFLISPETNIFYIQTFLTSLNDALRAAHNANGFLSSPPYVYYDYSVDYLKIVFDVDYYDNHITLFFNRALLLKFTGFQNKFYPGAINGQDYEILYQPLADNYFQNGISELVNYACLVMTSQNKFITDFLEFQSIIISSKSLPLNQQYISSQDGVNKTLSILSIIPIDFSNATNTRYVYYRQEYPLWVDTTSQGHLQTMDVEIYYSDDFFNIYPLTLLPQETMTLRVQFIKKNLVQNF